MNSSIERFSELSRVVDFLQSIGLEMVQRQSVKGFVNHVRIVAGAIEFDAKCSFADLLHECGHVAIVPAEFRGHLNDDVEESFQKIFELYVDLELDDPRKIAFMQAGDAEATAWTWAAGKKLGLADKQIIRDRDYQGAGADQRLALSMRHHYGIQGLRRSGMCAHKFKFDKQYPEMLRWVQS